MFRFIIFLLFIISSQNSFSQVLSLDGFQITSKGKVLGDLGTLEKQLWKIDTVDGVKHYESTSDYDSGTKYDVYLKAGPENFPKSHVVLTLRNLEASSVFRKNEVYKAISIKVDENGKPSATTHCRDYASIESKCFTINKKFCDAIYNSLNPKSIKDLISSNELCGEMNSVVSRNFLWATSELNADHKSGLMKIYGLAKKGNFIEQNSFNMLDAKSNVSLLVSKCNEDFWKDNEKNIERKTAKVLNEPSRSQDSIKRSNKSKATN